MLPSISHYRILCPDCGTLRLAHDLPLGPLSYCPICHGPKPWTYDLAPILPMPNGAAGPDVPKHGRPKAPIQVP